MADPVTISAFVASWFTPSSLFLFLNLVIVTIVISSRFGAPSKPSDHHHYDGNRPLVRRSSSLLQRFRSLHFYKHDAAFPETEYLQPVHDSPQLVRTPSLIERVRSFNFGVSNTVCEPTGADTVSVQPDDLMEHPSEPQLARTPSFLERLRSMNFSSLYRSDSIKQAGEVTEGDCDVPESVHHHYDGMTEHPSEPKLARTPSLLERLKSMNVSSLYRSDSIKQAGEVTEGDCDVAESEEDHDGGNLVRRSKSETSKWTPVELPEKMKKSASDKAASRRQVEGVTPEPGTARYGEGNEMASFVDDETVDAKADDFINRFKQQLKLQRLNSFLRYRETIRAN